MNAPPAIAPIPPSLSFRRPGSEDWKPLDGTEDSVKDAKAELKNILLSSLQMQHLVVLAGSGCSLAAGGPSMGKLWELTVKDPPSNEAEAVALQVNHPIGDRDIEAFLSKVEAFLQVKEDPDARAFLTSSKKAILEACSNFLDLDKLAAHATFLHRLSRRRVRDQRLRLFTTNYDLCFERSASSIGGVALDGFSFGSPRFYDPRYFSYDIIRRPGGGDDLGHYLEGVFLLYKLHGSVAWARKPSSGSIFEEADPKPEEACIIYPAHGKYQQSFVQPHLESLAQYLASLREPNSCVVVVGFGFNDAHLAEPLVGAIETNPHLRVWVVDSFAEQRQATGNDFWLKLFDLSLKGEDVWFINAPFDKFSEMLPDLKSLTPAENLLRTIKSAAGS